MADARKRLLARGWAFVPAASGPLGGGLLKLGHGSTTAALAVALAPCALWALLLSVFAAGYLAALARCIWRTGDQEAMERMIMVSARAVVSILTLTVPALLARRPHPRVPGLPRGREPRTPRATPGPGRVTSLGPGRAGVASARIPHSRVQRWCRSGTARPAQARLSQATERDQQSRPYPPDLRGLLTGSDAACGVQSRMFRAGGHADDAAVPLRRPACRVPVLGGPDGARSGGP